MKRYTYIATICRSQIMSMAEDLIRLLTEARDRLEKDKVDVTPLNEAIQLIEESENGRRLSESNDANT